LWYAWGYLTLISSPTLIKEEQLAQKFIPVRQLVYSGHSECLKSNEMTSWQAHSCTHGHPGLKQNSERFEASRR
jgi:hypothetical protein